MTLKAGTAAINGIGNDVANVLLGNAQANSLAGFGGEDSLEGYEGNDTLAGGDAADTLRGGLGNDSMTGDAGDDLLVGAAGLDVLQGGAGNDTLQGDADADTLAGGAGDDTYEAYNDDIVTELAGEGTDIVLTTQNFTLGSNIENLTLKAGSLAVNGIGNAAVNYITGNSVANSLSGLSGNDTLIGDGGTDTLLGGNGNDLLVVTDALFGQLLGGKNTDTVQVTGAGITLDLTAIADTNFADIERIDIAGSGDNILMLNLAEVLNASSSTNALTVWGDSGDTIHTGTGWTLTGAGSTVDSGHVLDTYSNGKGTLLIEAGMWVLV